MQPSFFLPGRNICLHSRLAEDALCVLKRHFVEQNATNWALGGKMEVTENGQKLRMLQMGICEMHHLFVVGYFSRHVAVWQLQVWVWWGIFQLFSVKNIKGKAKMFQTNSACSTLQYPASTPLLWLLVSFVSTLRKIRYVQNNCVGVLTSTFKPNEPLGWKHFNFRWWNLGRHEMCHRSERKLRPVWKQIPGRLNLDEKDATSITGQMDQGKVFQISDGICFFFLHLQHGQRNLNKLNHGICNETRKNV